MEIQTQTRRLSDFKIRHSPVSLLYHYLINLKFVTQSSLIFIYNITVYSWGRKKKRFNHQDRPSE